MNSIATIQPYRHNGTWVFDDAAVGLVREPFVAGVPEMIDRLVHATAGTERGFRVLFSAGEFPGAQVCLHWMREEIGGNWYRWEEGGLEGWLCPAMFKYFEPAPRHLYVRLEPTALPERTIVVPRAQVELLRDRLRAGDVAGAQALVDAVLA